VLLEDQCPPGQQREEIWQIFSEWLLVSRLIERGRERGERSSRGKGGEGAKDEGEGSWGSRVDHAEGREGKRERGA
jgi:hypothetical protein